jgi:hypothetical protein
MGLVSPNLPLEDRSMAKFPSEVTECVVVLTSRGTFQSPSPWKPQSFGCSCAAVSNVMGVGFSLVFLRRRRVADAMVAPGGLNLIVVLSLSTQR